MKRALKAKAAVMLTTTLLLVLTSSADGGIWMGMGRGMRMGRNMWMGRSMWMGRGMWGSGHHHRGYYGSSGSWGSWGGSRLSLASRASYGGYGHGYGYGCGYGYRIYRIYHVYRHHGVHPYSYQGNLSPAYPAYSRAVSAKQRPLEKSTLAVNVPAGATVFVNGRRTETKGTYREFELRTRRSRHSYRVRAVVDDNGRELTQTKLAILSAGRSAEISFDFDSPVVSHPQRESTTQQSAQTSRLIVKVPENATVFVNGRRTNSTGKHREYELQTRQRHSYRVRAVVDKGGLELSETKLAVLSPGASAEMSFDFDSDVAANSEPARLTDFGRVTLVNAGVRDS